MIIGLDHITLNTNNLKKEIIFYKKKKYKVFFKQNILNDKNKIDFLKIGSKFHKTVFLKKEGKNSIELTKYNKNNLKVKNLFFKNRVFTCYVKNLSREKEFLKKVFNFKIKKNYACLKTFSKDLSFKLKIKKTNSNYISYLDDLGYVGICLISSNLEKIRKISKKFSLVVSKKFVIKVNNKFIKICLIKSPNNLIYEIIEF
tara:strand:- start:1916 stop:2518 length:603 start_codon:yes stop_codon:yes gene_type:complete